MLYESGMEYRLGVILRCLVVLAIGGWCLYYANDALLHETDGDALLIVPFLLCLYAGAVCGLLGREMAFATLLFIKDLGCIGLAIWVFLVTVLSFILIPIVLTWHVSALILSFVGASFRSKFVRTLLCILLAGGVFGSIAMYVNYTIENHYHVTKKVQDEEEKLDTAYPALHDAVRACDADKVRKLIKAGANVNEKDFSGDTPLHLAARKGYLSCVKALLDAPLIDTSITNDDGKTPEDVAQDNGNRECAAEIFWATH